MPRVKTESENQRLYDLLRGRDITGTALAATINCCEKVARRKLKDPGLLTVSELKRICRKYGIPIQDIRDALFR